MSKSEKWKMEAVEAAKAFTQSYFPDCQGAILAGSVVRGEGTPTSDLDIIIFDQEISTSYRESLIAFDWPIEVFDDLIGSANRAEDIFIANTLTERVLEPYGGRLFEGFSLGKQ